LEALRLLQLEPERVTKLNANGKLFLERAKAAGLDTGFSIGSAIVPIIAGGSIRAGRLAEAMFRRGVNVQPILYPAVPEPLARLRFFLSSQHTEAQIVQAVEIMAEENARIGSEDSNFLSLTKLLGITGKA
jgi:8-amino-7-oxononanoate synthase